MKRMILSSIHRLVLPALLLLGVGTTYAANFVINYPTETAGTCDIPYHWKNKTLYKDGIYKDTTVVKGKGRPVVDTLHIYTLEFFTHPLRTVGAEIVEGNSLSYRGKSYTTAGTFYDTIHTATGCDSLIRLYITYADYFHMYDTAHVCEGGTYTNWRGRSLSIPGNYFDSLRSVGGKDSIYQMTLIVHYPAEVWDTVNVCPGTNYYYWNGRRYTRNGNYTMNLKSPYGCDSTAHLHLTFLTEPQKQTLTEYFCSNTGVVLHGRACYKDTTVVDTFPSYNGCDSIVETHYIPRPSQLYEDFRQHFKGQPFTWRGKEYKEDGLYYDSLTNMFGCDSVYQLRLVTKSEIYRIVNRCEGDTAMHGTITVDKNSVFIDTLRTTKGGDSIVHTTYNFERAFHSYEEITICSNQYVAWEGHPRWSGQSYDSLLHVAGIYQDKYHTVTGCDSIYIINVNVLPASIKDSVVIMCVDSVFKYGPIQWTDSKGKTHSFTSTTFLDTTIIDTMSHTMPEVLEYPTGGAGWTPVSGGCDSIFSMRVIITDRCSMDRYPMCENGSLSIDGKLYTQPGHYANLLPSSHQLNLLDSLHTFDIYTVYPTEETRDTTVCQLDMPITYNSRRLETAGTYDFTLRTQYGCDSVIHLRLAVTPLKYSPINEVQFCPNEPLTFRMGNGRVITQPGDYNDTIPWEGCDSVVRWRIKWAPTFLKRDTVVFKPGTSYTWHKDGQPRVLDKEGVYWDSCTNVYGCDSVYHLYLKEAQPFYQEEEPEVLCSNQLPWYWHGKRIAEAGTYWDSCHTYFGLDSVYKIEVSMFPSYTIEKQVTICANEEYRVNGKLVTGAIYRDSLLSKNGCDSVTIYYINRDIMTVKEETQYFAKNTVFKWRNNQYTHGGDYYDTIRSRLGCDSVLYLLHLIEEHPYHFFTDTTVCLPQNGHFSWHGKTFHESGTYYDSLTSWFSLDSVWQLNLTIHRDTVVLWHEDLCTGGSYDFFGHILTKPGTYTSEAFPRVNTGCDSIIQLILQPVSTQETVIQHTLCEGETYTIGDTTFATNGFYVDSLTSSGGCDSIVRHVFTVGKKYFTTSERLINPGSSFTWSKDGQPWVLTQPGTYFDSCLTILGCDSINKLILRFNQVDYIFPTETDHVCSADLPYVWHHKSLTATGLYYDSLKTNNGRDSVYSIYLTVYTTKHTNQEWHYCQGERPVINDIPYEKDAVFTDTLTSYTGCDSIVDYVLHFHPNYSMTAVTAIHEGESYQFGDTVIKTSGVYYRHFTTQYGCDSLVTLVVRSCPTAKEVTIHHNLCEGEPLVINGKSITTSGTYYETKTAVDGCDSLVCHIVNFHNSYFISTSETICRNGVYKWYGHKNDIELTQQGVYYDSLKTTYGCDSIYRLILNYKRTDMRDTIISKCEDELPFKYKDKYIFKDSVIMDTLGANTEGCDSVLRLTFRVNYHCSEYVQYNRCVGQIISIDGLLISEEGAYQQNHLTEEGQDSLYRFTVRNVQNYEFITKKSGCDSVVYGGKTYYARSTDEETFTVDLYHRTVDGCDSLEHLELTIRMSSPGRIYSKTIADYDSVRFGPYYYNTTGSYSLRYTNAKGCDSIEILNLTVLETEHQEIIHHYICQGDPRGVEVFGRRIYPTEEYTYISDTTWIAGMPVIRTADITVQHPFSVVSFDPNEDQIVCSEHEVMFYVSYSTSDKTNLPDYYEVDFLLGDLEAHPLHQEGTVDGKTVLPITMDGQGRFVAPGYYRYRLKLRSESCVVSDTILEGSITVRYPSSIMETAWDDAVLLVNEKYNGGAWVFNPPYKWQVLSDQGVDKTALVVAGDIKSPYLHSSELKEGDRIIATLYREGYKQPVPSCEFVFKPSLPVLTNPILVYPSAVPARMPVTISSDEPGAFMLLDQTGRLYTKGNFPSGQTQVVLPGVKGCYFMVLEDERAHRNVQRLIVY